MKSITRKTVRAALALALLLTLLAPALANASPANIATKSTGLNMRQGPGTGYSVIRSFPKGTQVEVLSTDGSWAYVYVGGCYGYMSAAYLSATAPAVPGGVYVDCVRYVNVNGNWYPIGANGLPVGSRPGLWGPLSGTWYPWEDIKIREEDKPLWPPYGPGPFQDQ